MSAHTTKWILLLALIAVVAAVLYFVIRRSKTQKKDDIRGTATAVPQTAPYAPGGHPQPPETGAEPRKGERQTEARAASATSQAPGLPLQEVRDQSGNSTTTSPPSSSGTKTAHSRTGVFISYRRDDKRDFARGLYERLARHLGEPQIFMDVDSIDLGADFTDVINQRLAQCSVMLVVIGKNWLDCVDSGGRRRLDNPDDLVRVEVETALARTDVRVIPILVDGAKAPESTELPESLRSLARRNALVMTHENFGADFGRLFTVVERIVGP
jgi:TIR domain